MKIYTRTGDDGSTGLIGGRTTKADPRIQAIGAVDELNASLGLAAVSLRTSDQTREQVEAIYRTQRECFVVGAYLAAPDPAKVKPLLDLNDALIATLESEIDTVQNKLTPLRFFILPGGSEPSARLHFARTLCRRAESWTVHLRQLHPDTPEFLCTYLNRLSDWLFVQARYSNHLLGVEDVPWHRDQMK